MRLMKIVKYIPFALMGITLMSCGDEEMTTTTSEKPVIESAVTFHGAGSASSDGIQMATTLFDHRMQGSTAVYSITITMTNMNTNEYDLLMHDYDVSLDGTSIDTVIYKNYDPTAEIHDLVSDVSEKLAQNEAYSVDFAITIPDGKWTTDYVITFVTNNDTSVSIHMAGDTDFSW